MVTVVEVKPIDKISQALKGANEVITEQYPLVVDEFADNVRDLLHSSAEGQAVARELIERGYSPDSVQVRRFLMLKIDPQIGQILQKQVQELERLAAS